MKHTMPYAGPAHPPWWRVTESWEHNGTPVALGQQLTLAGGRTVYRFVNYTEAPPRPGSGRRLTKQWVTLLGPEGYRSVRPEQVGKVLPPMRPKRPRKKPGS